MQIAHLDGTANSGKCPYLLKVFIRYKKLINESPPNKTEIGYREAELTYNPLPEKFELLKTLPKEDREIYKKFIILG